MGLYLIQHTHPVERCPRKNLEMVRQLASHVTPATAAKYGVKILADWVDESEHTVVLVLEAERAEQAASFALPFLNAGQITVRAGQTCDEVARECLGQ